MKFLQQSIEKKLSSLLGAEVRFERLKVSPLSGTLEAEGMTVAGEDPGRPMMSVRKIRAEVAVAKALAGQIVAKSVVIEGAEVFLSRRKDGSISLPRPKAAVAETAQEKEGGWQFEARSIRIVDGRVHFQDIRDVPGYRASAEQISGELSLKNGRVDFRFHIGSIGRRDIAAEFGPMEMAGEVDGAGSLDELKSAKVRAELRFANGINLAAMPPGITLPPWKFSGPVEGQVRLGLDPGKGIRIHEMSFRASDIGAPLTRKEQPPSR